MDLDEDILDDGFILNPIVQPKPKRKTGDWFLVLFLQLFGLGLFKVQPEARRKWFYLGLFFYSWVSFINVFVRIFPEMERFHNKTEEGAATIFVAWGLLYIVGMIDVAWTFWKRTG